MAKRLAVDSVEPDGGIGPEMESATVENLTQEVKAEHGEKHKKHGKKKATDFITDKVKAKAGKSMFSAFMVAPSKIAFQNEDDNEEILLLLRAHPVTMVPWIIGAFLLLLVPFVVIPILVAVNVLPISSGGVLVLTLIWIAGVFSFSFINFLYWYFNVYIVTTEQLVDIDWYNIVNKAVSSALITKVQDVTSKQGGVLAGIFDYGTVEIQTAGTENNFEFTNVPHPQEVAEEIQNLMEGEGVEGISVDTVGGTFR